MCPVGTILTLFGNEDTKYLSGNGIKYFFLQEHLGFCLCAKKQKFE